MRGCVRECEEVRKIDLGESRSRREKQGGEEGEIERKRARDSHSRHPLVTDESDVTHSWLVDLEQSALLQHLMVQSPLFSFETEKLCRGSKDGKLAIASKVCKGSKAHKIGSRSCKT